MTALASSKPLVEDALPPKVLEATQTGNALLDSYLDRLTAPMKGSVPPDEIIRFRVESAFHLKRMIDGYLAQGQPADEATGKAIQEFGGAAFTADEYLLHWYESEPTSPLVKRLGRANSIVFCLFGMGTAIYLFLVELAILFPSTSPLKPGTSPAQLHRFYPQHLPYPEATWQFLAVVGYPLLMPLALGWLAGRTIPVRAASAVFWGLLPIIVVSFIVGMSLLPDRAGIFFFILQACYWLPTACLMAGISSSLLRRSRLRPVKQSEGETVTAVPPSES